MFDLLPEAWALAAIGLFGGIILGLAARLGGFCTLGVIEDALYAGRFARLGMWLWALGLAIALTAVGGMTGFIDRSQSIFSQAPVSLTGAIGGGLLFGYGMALAGTCGFTALARFGSGDLRAFVILMVIGISAYITISGPLAYLRLYLTGEIVNTGWIDFALARILGFDAAIIAILIGAALSLGAISISSFRQDSTAIFWASLVAVAIVSGWAGTTYVAVHGFEPTLAASHSYSAPIGQTLLYLMTSTGDTPSFGIGSVIGVIAGAFAGSLLKGRFAWEACDDPRELSRQIFGAFLMGGGAVLALGCSIGQGLTGMAVLNWTAPVVLASISTGAVIGIKQLVHGLG